MNDGKNEKLQQALSCCAAARETGYFQSLRAALEALAQRYALGLVVLFGSLARDRVKDESDLDIGVLVSGNVPSETLELEGALAGELWRILRPAREIDLVILNQATSHLKYNVANTGILLYASSEELWRSFRLRSRREFEDEQKFRYRRWQQLKERTANGQTA